MLFRVFSEVSICIQIINLNEIILKRNFSIITNLRKQLKAGNRNVNAEYLGGASSSNRSFCKTIARWQEALVTLESPGFSRGEDVKNLESRYLISTETYESRLQAILE